MLQAIKWIITTVFTVALLLGLALIAAAMWIDPNDYRDDIAAIITEQTGQQVTLEGDIALRVFPQIGLNVSHLEISYPPQMENLQSIRVEDLNLGLSLRPLLHRELVLDVVTARQVDIEWLQPAPDTRTQQTQPAPVGGGIIPAAKTASPRNAATLSVAGVRIDALNVTLIDEATGDKQQIGPINLQTGPIEPNTPVDLSVKGPYTLETQAQAQWQAGHFQLEAQGTEATGSQFTVSLTGQTDIQPITMTGMLEMAHDDLRALLQALDHPFAKTPNPALYQRMSLSTNIEFNGSRIKFSALDGLFDDSRFSGEASAQLRDELAVNLALSVDQLDLDRYLNAGANATAKLNLSPISAAQAARHEAAWLEPVRKLNLSGQMSVGQLQLLNLQLNAVEADVSSAQGLIRIHPITANLYGGTYHGDIRVDARANHPLLQVNDQLNNLALEPLLEDLLGIGWLTGTANGQIKLQATGVSSDALLQTLTGSVEFTAEEGLLKGINIAQQLRRGEADTGPRSTDFTRAAVNFDIHQGIARSELLTLQSPLFSADGTGEINLPAEHLDLHFRVRLERGDLRGTVVPLRIAGELTEPRLRLDIEQLIRERAADELRRLLERNLR